MTTDRDKRNEAIKLAVLQAAHTLIDEILAMADPGTLDITVQATEATEDTDKIKYTRYHAELLETSDGEWYIEDMTSETVTA